MKSTYILLLMFLTCSVFGQDPTFSMLDEHKLYLNPAYASLYDNLIVSMSRRSQWTNLPKRFGINMISASIGCEKAKIGFGAILLNNNEGEGYLKTFRASGIISKYEEIGNGQLMAGLKFGIGQRTIDWGKLTFSDQLHPKYGAIYNTAALPAGVRTNMMMHVGAGLLYYYRWNSKTFSSIGFSINHINEPNESIISQNSSLPVRKTIHFFQKIKVSARNTHSDYLSLGFAYDRQQNLQSMNAGISISYVEEFILGVWYRSELIYEKSSDAMIFSVLWDYNNKYKIAYSYDVTISKLGENNTWGTHEIYLSFSFKGAFLCDKGRKIGGRNSNINGCPVW